MLYPLTEENGYWAAVITRDIAHGWTAQRSVSDVFYALLLMNRTKTQALNIAGQAAYFAGVADKINW